MSRCAPALMYTCTPGLLICRHLLPWNTWSPKFSTLTFCCCSTNLERSLCRRYMCADTKSWVGENWAKKKCGKASFNSQMSSMATSAGLWGKLAGKGFKKKKTRREYKKGNVEQQFHFPPHTHLHLSILLRAEGSFCVVYNAVLLLQLESWEVLN